MRRLLVVLILKALGEAFDRIGKHGAHGLSVGGLEHDRLGPRLALAQAHDGAGGECIQWLHDDGNHFCNLGELWLALTCTPPVGTSGRKHLNVIIQLFYLYL